MTDNIVHQTLAMIGLPGSVVPALARELSTRLELPLVRPSGRSGSIEDPARKHDLTRGYLFAGFPLFVLQAQALDATLNAMGQPLQQVISLGMPADGLTGRIRGRRRCASCGEPVNLYRSSRSGMESCPVCGGPLEALQAHDLIREEEQLLAAMRHFRRLNRYYRSQNKLLSIDATGGPEDVLQRIGQVLRNRGV